MGLKLGNPEKKHLAHPQAQLGLSHMCYDVFNILLLTTGINGYCPIATLLDLVNEMKTWLIQNNTIGGKQNQLISIVNYSSQTLATGF